jgi:C4-type Zn-finger protein
MYSRLRHCPLCGRYRDDVAKRRLNTAYHKDALNWTISCEDCFHDAWEYYQEQWETYYDMIR